MRIGCKPPVFVPNTYTKRLDLLSKAALMDVCWDLAKRDAGGDLATDTDVINQLEATIAIVKRMRQSAEASA